MLKKNQAGKKMSRVLEADQGAYQMKIEFLYNSKEIVG